MRLATELVPTYAAILGELFVIVIYLYSFYYVIFVIKGPRLLSPFWVVLFYFSMITFALAQQLAIVHTLVSSIIAIRPGNSFTRSNKNNVTNSETIFSDHFLEFESAITFVSCLLGLVFCFPLATELGIHVVYFFDYVVGCAWWTIALQLALVLLVKLFIDRKKFKLQI